MSSGRTELGGKCVIPEVFIKSSGILPLNNKHLSVPPAQGPSSLHLGQFPWLLAVYLRCRSNHQIADINPLYHLYFHLPPLTCNNFSVSAQILGRLCPP